MSPAARLLRFGVLLLALGSFGCVSLERSYPEKRFFVIEVKDAKRANPGDGQVLSMSNLHISPRYADRGFVYRTSEAEYESDFYNQFLSSPAVMISEESRKALAASSKFKFVVGPSSANRTLPRRSWRSNCSYTGKIQAMPVLFYKNAT
jgi:hypothetical protein